MNEIRAFFRAVGSLWFAAVILVLLMIAMGAATVYEMECGAERTLASFYYTWWFRGLLALGALNLFAAMAARFPWEPRQTGFLMTHTGLLVTLLGALVTQHCGVNGQVGIEEGEALGSFLDFNGSTLTVANRTDGTEAVLDLAASGVGGFEVIESPKMKRARAGDDITVEVVRYLPDTVWRRVKPEEGGEEKLEVSLRTPLGKETRPAILVRATVGEAKGEVWVGRGRPRPLRVGGKDFRFVYSARQVPLGFALKLDRFHIEYYPGSMQPRSFESTITLRDPKDGLAVQRKVSMNHPASFGGYTFFQKSYQLSRDGSGPAVSFLGVSRDPGQPLAFAGYFLTILGMFIVLVQRMRDPRRMGRAAVGAAVVLLALLWGTAPASAQDAKPAPAAKEKAAEADAPPRLPADLDLSVIRKIVVQHDGRWKPLDTLARQSVWEVVGRESYAGRDPITVLLSWTFDARRWMATPVITVKSAEARAVIGLDAGRTAFSFDELVAHPGLRRHFQARRNQPRDNKKPDPLQKLVDQIHAKMMDLHEVHTGARIRLIPHATQRKGRWLSAEQLMTRGANNESLKPVREAWTAVGQAFLKEDRDGFRAATERLAGVLAALPAAHRPAASEITIELAYNDLNPFRWAWIIMAAGFAASVLGLFIRLRIWDGLVALVLAAGVAVGVYGLWLRGQLAGEIPATNMYESLLFLGLGVGAFAVVAMPAFRIRFIPLICCFLGALSLFLTDVLPLNHFVRPIVPVLRDTYWMTIHVPIIMVSYAVLFLGVLVAHILVVTMAATPRKDAFIETLDRIHYWFIHVGSILLFIGILTGSMWGAEAWGRYWGWDPKEVWSLVAFFGYMALMHLRVNRERIPAWAYAVAVALGAGVFGLVVPQLALVGGKVGLWFAGVGVAAVFFLLASGRLAVAVKSILAFWLIIMTYIGVNYVLGVGMHSYGFGTGAVRNWAFGIGAIDLAIVIVCGLIYLARRPRGPAAAL